MWSYWRRKVTPRCVLTHKASGYSPVVHPTQNKVGKERNCTSKPGIPRSHTAQGKTSWVNRLTVTGGGSLCCRSFFCQTRSRPSSPESLANADLGRRGARRDNAERQGAVTEPPERNSWRLLGSNDSISESFWMEGTSWDHPVQLNSSRIRPRTASHPRSWTLHSFPCTWSSVQPPSQAFLCVSFFEMCFALFWMEFSCVSVCAHWLSPCTESSSAPSPPHAPSRELLMCIDHTTPAFPGSTVPFLTQFTCFVSEQLYNKQVFELIFILLKKTRQSAYWYIFLRYHLILNYCNLIWHTV